MKTILMNCSDVVEGIRRKAGDLVVCQPYVAQRLVNEGKANWTRLPDAPEPERRDARPVSPNRMKFASQVKALDPHAEDFAMQVATLQGEYEQREAVVRELMAVLVEQEADMQQILRPGDTALLLQGLRAAIERFVVDRY